ARGHGIESRSGTEMKNSPYLDQPFIPLAVALRSMLADTEAKIATAAPAEKARLQERAEGLREGITPRQSPTPSCRRCGRRLGSPGSVGGDLGGGGGIACFRHLGIAQEEVPERSKEASRNVLGLVPACPATYHAVRFSAALWLQKGAAILFHPACAKA